jgi:hypothetical protein
LMRVYLCDPSKACANLPILGGRKGKKYIILIIDIVPSRSRLYP